MIFVRITYLLTSTGGCTGSSPHRHVADKLTGERGPLIAENHLVHTDTDRHTHIHSLKARKNGSSYHFLVLSMPMTQDPLSFCIDLMDICTSMHQYGDPQASAFPVNIRSPPFDAVSNQILTRPTPNTETEL